MLVRQAAQFIPADKTQRKLLSHAGGSDLYYKSTPDVSSVSKDGTLKSGESAVTFSAGVWVISASQAALTVTEVSEATDPTGKDLATQAELDAAQTTTSAALVTLTPATEARNVLKPSADTVALTLQAINGAASARLFSVLKEAGSPWLEIGPPASGEAIVEIGPEFTRSLYQGGGNKPALGVDGKLEALAGAGDGEHRLTNSSAGNNSVAIRNLNNEDGYSTVRFIDKDGIEGCAFGYGNPGTALDYPFAGAAYWESSHFVTDDGEESEDQDVRPMRVVQTGNFTDTAESSGVRARTEWATDGSWNFFNLYTLGFSTRKTLVQLKPDASAYFNAPDGTTPILSVRPVGAWTKAGAIIGVTGKTAGGVPPQVALDCVGTGLFGVGVDTGRPSNFTATKDFAIATYQPEAQQVRLVRPSVVKLDVLVNTASAPLPVRVDFTDPDHSSVVPLRLSLDGLANIFLTGATSAGGGKGVVCIKNTVEAPGTNPTEGGVLYVEAGALKYRGSGGKVTELAAAS